MKKLIISGILLTSILLSSINAQTISAGPGRKQFYFSGYVGYSLGFGSTIGTNTKYTSNNTGYSYSYENIYGSYGTGIGGGIGVGYFFNDYIGVELNGIIQALNTPQTYNYPSTGLQFKLSPVVVIKAPLGKLAPYAKFGLVLPLSTSYTTQGDPTIYYAQSGNNLLYPYPQGDSKTKTTMEVALGLTASIGTYVHISKNISLFGEFILTALSQNKSKSMVTSYVVNGEDQVSSLNTYQKETEYSSSYTESYTYYQTTTVNSGYQYVYPDDYDSNRPKKQLTESVPFTSIGFQIGIVYSFGGK